MCLHHTISERSLSTLRALKSHLNSTMREDSLNGLALNYYIRNIDILSIDSLIKIRFNFKMKNDIILV